MNDVPRAIERAEQLRALLDSQDRLIGSVAHELRTPLSAVVGLSSELRDRAGSMSIEELVDLSTIIAEQSTSIAAVLEDLLAVARMRGPGLTVSAVPVDLPGEVALAASSLGVADRLAVTGTGLALGDPQRVRQVIRNLLSNAFRYGGSNVKVEIELDEAVAVVDVSDDGPGVDPERVDRIFDDFERSHDDPGRAGSLGLGLTTARGLARLMMGDVVYEREGNSTRFRLTLPVSQAAPEEIRELVYQSRANTDIGPVEIERILTVARDNNRKADISGLLVYHEGDFLQVLEGPPDQVERVFAVIRNDPRHYRVNVIVDRAVSQRSFTDWEMGFHAVDDLVDNADGVSKFLRGGELPLAAGRYIQMLFDSFRDSRYG